MFATFLVLVVSFLSSLFSRYTEPFSVPVDTVDSLAMEVQVVRVIDGDTIDVKFPNQTETTRVRYIGINTPEPYSKGLPECGSKEASDRNRELVYEQKVKLVYGAEPVDKYGRTLAYVYTGDIFVNRVLLEEGYATVMMIHPNTKYQTEFDNIFQNTQTQKRGIWQYCD